MRTSFDVRFYLWAMPNRRLTPLAVAQITAFCLAAIIALLTLFLPQIVDGWRSWYSLVVFFGVFLITLALVLFGIRKFVQSRVDQIHRTVHDARTKRSMEELSMSKDVLGQISEDVQEWAEEKREEIEELKERENYRREFIGNLAHELKTPITSIQGYILTLLEGGLEDENVNRRFLVRASNGVERLTAIVDDMDTITRLEEGIIELAMEQTDLHELVEEVLNAMNQQAKKAGIGLENKVSPYSMVLCDSKRVIQVFINLVNNAIKYGKDGGLVSVSSYAIEDRVMIEVVDNGIGIQEEHLPRLFERFYRVGSSRSRHEGGSGLGLAIVKHIIEAHGQAITVVSEVDEGTRFTFSLSQG